MKIYFIVYFILFVANYNVFLFFFYAGYMPELLFVSFLIAFCLQKIQVPVYLWQGFRTRLHSRY